MSQPASIVMPSPPGAWKMYRAMVGIGLLCGLLIVTVFELTRPVIERKQAEALRAAIFEVLPDASSTKTFRLDGDGRFVVSGDESTDRARIHAGYDDAQNLVGFAIEAQGMGYQDVIRVIFGYSPVDAAVIGIRVLDSKETPGLGDKIESDPEFLENFRRLDVSLTDDLSRIAHPVVVVKHGAKDEPWEVDGITGATISSAAIASILERSTAYWIPLIHRNLDDFREQS